MFVICTLSVHVLSAAMAELYGRKLYDLQTAQTASLYITEESFVVDPHNHL